MGTSVPRGDRVAACEQRHVMPKRDQLFRQPGDNTLRSAIELRRHALGERRDLGDAHGIRLPRTVFFYASNAKPAQQVPVAMIASGFARSTPQSDRATAPASASSGSAAAPAPLRADPCCAACVDRRNPPCRPRSASVQPRLRLISDILDKRRDLALSRLRSAMTEPAQKPSID